MGSNHSVQTYIQTETLSFQPGGPITGVININVDSSVPAHLLQIRLVGKEKTRWTKTDLFSNSKKFRLFSESFKVVEASYPIQSFQESLPKGQYTVPFSIVTPGWLPPTFKHEDYPLRAEIYYYIKAVVDDKTKTKAIKSIVWASSHPPHGAVPRSLSEHADFDVRNFCCFKAGLTVMTASVSRDFGFAGDQFEVTVQVDNSQGLKIANGIRLNLARIIEIQGREMLGFARQSNQIRNNLLHVDQAIKVLPGSKSDSDKPFKLNLNLNGIRELYKYPSARGAIVKCSYYLEVIIYFNNFCGCHNYKISFPINIHNQGVDLSEHAVRAPEVNFEWRPVAMTQEPIISTLAIPSPTEYQENPVPNTI